MLPTFTVAVISSALLMCHLYYDSCSTKVSPKNAACASLFSSYLGVRHREFLRGSVAFPVPPGLGTTYGIYPWPLLFQQSICSCSSAPEFPGQVSKLGHNPSPLQFCNLCCKNSMENAWNWKTEALKPLQRNTHDTNFQGLYVRLGNRRTKCSNKIHNQTHRNS